MLDCADFVESKAAFKQNRGHYLNFQHSLAYFGWPSLADSQLLLSMWPALSNSPCLGFFLSLCLSLSSFLLAVGAAFSTLSRSALSVSFSNTPSSSFLTTLAALGMVTSVDRFGLSLWFRLKHLQYLQDGLSYLVQAFMVPGWWILTTLVIPWLFL